MNLYYRHGNHFAIFMEYSKKLGAHPVFQIKTCKGETILDIPYGQIILTPKHILAGEQSAPEKINVKKYKQKPEVSSRAAEN